MIVESVEKFTKANMVLPTIIRRNKKHVENSGTASEDYLTRQIVTNSNLLELVLNAAEKIQKQGYCQANIKNEITVICYLYNCNRKGHG